MTMISKKGEKSMTTDKKTARIAGSLFIIATAASLASSPFLASFSASNYLVDVSANQNQVLVGALFAFIAAVASASIAISLYPTLRKYDETLSLAAVGFRLIEGALYIVGIVSLLSLLTVSKEFVNAGAPSSSYFQTLGASLQAGYHWVNYVGAVVAFGLGALMYYYIFYQTKLVPRWLSGWGLVAATLIIAASMLVMFNVVGLFSTFQAVLILPIAVQEMALAVWLIVRGFTISPNPRS
jgi:MFS family permease